MAPMETIKLNNQKPLEGNSKQNCRRRLHNTFEPETTTNRSVLSVLTLNESSRKFLRNGAERLTKTYNNVRTTLGSLTQMFRVSTKRRQILEEGPMTPNPNCVTPHTFSKQVLGRTPTKLYSPFGVETPTLHKQQEKENKAP